MTRLATLRDRDSLIGQGFRFGAQTALSAGISLGLPVALHEGAGIAPEIAVAIAFAVAFGVNFFILRRLVFNSGRSAKRDFANFALSSLAFRGVEYVGFLVLFQVVGLNYALAIAIMLVGSSIGKFFWYKRTMHSPARDAVT